MLGAKRGQALIEVLPAIVLFLLVMSAGLNYFRVVRVAVIREEVVRNLAFDKIGYSGTLTSPERLYSGGSSGGTPLTGELGSLFGTDKPIEYTDGCFTVSPANARQEVRPAAPVYGVGAIAPVAITTYAVVYRSPAGNCPF